MLTQELAALSSKGFQLYKHLKTFMTSAISFKQIANLADPKRL
jgi:hypothetical protein